MEVITELYPYIIYKLTVTNCIINNINLNTSVLFRFFFEFFGKIKGFPFPGLVAEGIRGSSAGNSREFRCIYKFAGNSREFRCTF